MLDHFNTNFLNVLESHAPIKTVRIRPRCCPFVDTEISNGNRTEWSPIRSVIIRVMTKSDDREAGVRFVNHEYDYRPNWTTRSPIAN